MLDDRAKLLLTALVERYIADGQPVGSRTLSKASGLDLSPATIRNVMADLEELGLITSPHTSAGRVPTARGYRLFVDTMLTLPEGDGVPGMELPSFLPDQPQRVITHAAGVLSELSQFVGVITAPRMPSVFKHIEFLRLGDRRILLILVNPDGDVQNRIIFTQHDYTPSELVQASNFLNQHYAGLTLEEVQAKLQGEVEALRGEITQLMQAAVEVGSQAISASQEQVIVSGERNLLSVQDFSTDMHAIRKMFDLFEQKAQLMRLLDGSNKADGVRIYIGGESGVVPIQEMSVVTAPYTINGRVVGTLGVIGPTRMAYDRMIKIVDVTARMVSSALSVK